MNITRIQILKQYILDDPEDPFNHYALALEYQKENIPEALSIYNFLLEKYPNYLATYYQAALLYTTTGDHSNALRILQLGYDKAISISDLKAAKELLAEYNRIRDEEDD